MFTQLPQISDTIIPVEWDLILWVASLICPTKPVAELCLVFCARLCRWFVTLLFSKCCLSAGWLLWKKNANWRWLKNSEGSHFFFFTSPSLYKPLCSPRKINCFVTSSMVRQCAILRSLVSFSNFDTFSFFVVPSSALYYYQRAMGLCVCVCTDFRLLPWRMLELILVPSFFWNNLACTFTQLWWARFYSVVIWLWLKPFRLDQKCAFFLWCLCRYPRIYGPGNVWGTLRWICGCLCFWNVHVGNGYLRIPLLRMPECCSNLPESNLCE